MRKLSLLLLVFVLLEPPAFSQQKDWLAFKSIEENFVISFPTKPNVEKSDDRGFFQTGYHIYSARDGDINYSIGCYRIATPLDSKALERKFDYVTNLLLQGTVKLVNSKSITFDSHPGREVRVEGQKDLWILRVYVTPNWMYHILILQPKRKGERPETIRFYESFRLLNPTG